MSIHSESPPLGRLPTDDPFVPDHSPFPSNRHLSLLVNLLLGMLAILMFVGIAGWLHSQQTRTLSETTVAANLDAEGKLRPLAEVVQLTKSMKLVTVVVDSKVRAETGVDTWRGDVEAAVEAPVRYVYGVDLSNLEPNAFHTGTILRGYDIVVPRPERIAVEVDGSNTLDEKVRVTGTRFRTRAGEYYLGLARKKLYEQARKNTLSEEEMKQVSNTTKEQIEDLVRRFVGERAYVNVRYEDE